MRMNPSERLKKVEMKKEIYLEYESWRKEMRGSSDQTAMNNKHIKRFHFSISPPRSIRSGAAEGS